jgi:hypothetical protein
MRRASWLTFLRCVVLIAGTSGVLFAVMAAATPSPASAATSTGVAADGGVLGPLNPGDTNGVTIDHYDITADNGGTLDFGRKVLIFFINAAFAINRWIVGLASWLVEWVLDFKITNYLLGPVIKLSQVLESHLIIGTGLGAFALTLAAIVCGLWVLRGRRSKGLTEFAVTLVIAAFAATYVSSPASTVFGPTGLLSKTRDLSLEVGSLVVTDGRASTGGSERVTSEVRAMFVDTFVRNRISSSTTACCSTPTRSGRIGACRSTTTWSPTARGEAVPNPGIGWPPATRSSPTSTGNQPGTASELLYCR